MSIEAVDSTRFQVRIIEEGRNSITMQISSIMSSIDSIMGHIALRMKLLRVPSKKLLKKQQMCQLRLRVPRERRNRVNRGERRST